MAEGEPQASSRIFISYRREDSTGFVRALFEPLRARFGRGRVFKDTDNIRPGEDFVKVITRELESCKVLLAVIGNEWVNAQDARTKRRRLDDPNDTLRIEVSAALRNQDMTVIPVLVDQARMPRPEDLPEELWDLTRRNAVEVSDTRWDTDIDRLIRALEVICGDVSPAETEDGPGQEEQPERQERPEPEGGQVSGAGESGFTVVDRLVLRRKRQIAEHLKAAREAFDTQDYQTVLAECERAIWLDPECIEARDFTSRAQAAIDERSIQERLEEAERALAKNDLAAASEAIDLALGRSPEHPGALKLRQELLRVRVERNRQAEKKRLTAVELKSAQSSLDDGDFAAALSHVDEALTLEPDSIDAAALRVKIVAARAEAGRAREHKRRAQQVIADAQAAWADGRQAAAIEVLTNFAPPHDLIAQALQDFRGRIAQADEARRRAAAEQAEVAAQARLNSDAKLAQVDAAIASKQYGPAQQLVDAARALDPTNPALSEWQSRITDAMAADVAAERVRQDQEAEAVRREAARREAEVKDAAERATREAGAKLALVSAAIAERRYDDARALVVEARQIDSRHPDLDVWPQRIDEAVAADEAVEHERRDRQAQAARDEAARLEAAKQGVERARREADAKLALVAAAIAGKRYAAARTLMDEARRLDASHPAISAWQTRIDDAIEADTVAEIAKRERDAQAEREAKARDADARAAAERARGEADTKLVQLEAAMKAKRYDAARGLLEEARLLDSTHPALDAWPARIDAAIAADAVAERERQEREAEAARVEAERKAAAKAAAERARREADTKLAGVRTSIDAKRYSEARQLVAAARAIDATHPELGNWQRRIDEAVAADEAQERKKREEAENQARQDSDRRDQARQAATATLALVKAAVKEKRYQSARELLAAARQADPTHPALEEWEKKIVQQDRLPQPASSGWKKQVGVAAVLALTATVGTLVYRFGSGDSNPPLTDERSTVTPPANQGGRSPVPPAPSSAQQPSTTGQTPAAQPSTGTAAGGGAGTAVDPSPANRGGSVPEGQNTGGSRRGGLVSNGGQPANTPAGGGRRGTPQARGGEPAATPGPEATPTTPSQGTTNPAATPSGPGPSSGSTQTQTPAPTPPRGNPNPPPIAVNPQPGPIRGSGGTTPALPTPEQLAEEARLKQLAQDEVSIKGLLAQYAEAYSAKNEARLRALLPGFKGIPNKDLIRKVTVKLGIPRIVINGPSATLLVSQVLEYEWARAGYPPTSSGTVTFNLEREKSTWRIVSSNFR